MEVKLQKKKKQNRIQLKDKQEHLKNVNTRGVSSVLWKVLSAGRAVIKAISASLVLTVSPDWLLKTSAGFTGAFRLRNSKSLVSR